MPSFYGFNFQNYPTVSKLFGGQGYLSNQGYQPQQPPQPMGAMTQLNPVFQQALDNYNAGMSQFQSYDPSTQTQEPPQQPQTPQLKDIAALLGKEIGPGTMLDKAGNNYILRTQSRNNSGQVMVDAQGNPLDLRGNGAKLDMSALDDIQYQALMRLRQALGAA